MDAEFVFIAESGTLEKQSLLLCESIRRFGGAYASLPIKILQPRPERGISDEARSRFAAMDAEIIELAILSPCPEYGTTFRIFACAAYERLSQANVLIFLDSDTVLLSEPDFALTHHDVAVRPVDVKGMCTAGPADPFDAYWHDLCRICGVDYDTLPEVTTTVDRVRVKASYNGGLTVARRQSGLFGKTADFFQKSLDAGLVPWRGRKTTFPAGHGMVSAEGARMWGSAQAALSVAISALGLSVRILPLSQNFPLNFYEDLSSQIEAGTIPSLAHVHYHHLFADHPRNNPILAGKAGFPAGSAQWLRARMNADKRLILVLGMHRSGTSALTKSLQTLGVDLGSNFIPVTPDNPKGHWEDKDFYQLNEEMLKHLDCSWDDLHLMESDTILPHLEEYLPRAQAVLDTFLQDKLLAGLKDPRFSVLLPFWKKIFEESGIRVSFVIAYRNPLSVAASLSMRDDFPKTKSLWLWVIHSVLIARGTSNIPRMIVDYDEMLEHPRAQLERLGRFLHLSPEVGALESFRAEFLSADLRHACFSSADLRDDPACAPLMREIHELFAAHSLDSPESGFNSWEQAASRWEQSFRPFKSLLQENSLLYQDLAARKKQASLTELELQEKRERAACLETGNSWLLQKNEEHLESLKSLEAGNAWLMEKREELIRDNADLARRNGEFALEAEQLRQKIEEMQMGLSWKITAPLRFLARRLVRNPSSPES